MVRGTIHDSEIGLSAKRLHNPVLQYIKPERFRLINMVLIGELKEHADIVTKKFDMKM